MIQPSINLSLITILLTSSLLAQQPERGSSSVRVVGAMKNVMWKGELKGIVDLDTFAKKQHLYGFGPAEYLSGELLIMDGKGYKSTVLSDTTMHVEETFRTKAPFFAYAHVDKWNEHPLPDSIRTIPQLETFLDRITTRTERPFLFRLSGKVETATIHIVNLPKGTTVRSPDDAHRGQQNYHLKNVQSDILGFFSTEHKGIFTHHDTFLHMHLLAADTSAMGHLDAVRLMKGMRLYLPWSGGESGKR